MKIHSKKNSVKIILVVIGMLIVSSIILYTNNLVEKLKYKSREDLRFRIKVLEESLNQNPGGEVTFVFEYVIKNADFPIVYSNADHEILYWKNLSFGKDITFSKLDSSKQRRMIAAVKKMDLKNPPIPIRFSDTILGYYHYGDSKTITQLQILPYIEILTYR